MVDVRPFRALRPTAGLEARVVSPPYDVVDTAEARAYAAGDPLSFLRVSRPEIDLGDDVDPHGDEVYALGRSTLDAFVADGVLVRDDVPTYSVYRQVMGDVVQTGVVATVAVDGLRREAGAHPRAHAPRQGGRPGAARRRARRPGRAGVPAVAPLGRRRRGGRRRGRTRAAGRPRLARRRGPHALGRRGPRRGRRAAHGVRRGGRPLRGRRPPPQRCGLPRARAAGRRGGHPRRVPGGGVPARRRPRHGLQPGGRATSPASPRTRSSRRCASTSSSRRPAAR